MARPVSRRRFIDLLLAGEFLALAAAVLYPIAKFLFPRSAGEFVPPEVKVGPPEDILPGTGKLIQMGPKPVLVLRTPEGELRALSAVCTHLNCTVQFRQDLNAIYCACHDGKYDLAGRNVAGPPPRPLDVLAVEVREGTLYVKRT